VVQGDKQKKTWGPHGDGPRAGANNEKGNQTPLFKY
jgi:hypothetical protein